MNQRQDHHGISGKNYTRLIWNRLFHRNRIIIQTKISIIFILSIIPLSLHQIHITDVRNAEIVFNILHHSYDHDPLGGYVNFHIRSAALPALCKPTVLQFTIHIF